MSSIHPIKSQSSSDVLFNELTTKRLTRDLLLRLFAGTVGAIRITNALPIELADSYLTELDPSLFGGYAKDRYQLPATRLGPVLNEFRGTNDVDEAYWQQAEKTVRYWDSQPIPGDLRRTSMNVVQSAWDARVMPASSQKRELFWGILREINSGTLIHWDEVIREYPIDFLDRLPIVQLAFNVFLSAPDQGGETSIWRKRWVSKGLLW